MQTFYIFSERVYQALRNNYQQCVEEMDNSESLGNFPGIADFMGNKQFTEERLEILLKFLVTEICPKVELQDGVWVAKSGTVVGRIFTKLKANMSLVDKINRWYNHRKGGPSYYTMIKDSHIPESQSFERAFCQEIRCLDFRKLRKEETLSMNSEKYGVSNRRGYADLISFLVFGKGLAEFEQSEFKEFHWDLDVLPFIKGRRDQEFSPENEMPELMEDVVENESDTKENEAEQLEPVVTIPQRRVPVLAFVITGIAGFLLILRALTANYAFSTENNFFQHNHITGDNNHLQISSPGPIGKNRETSWQPDEAGRENVLKDVTTKAEYFSVSTETMKSGVRGGQLPPATPIKITGYAKNRNNNRWLQGVLVKTSDGQVAITDSWGKFEFKFPASENNKEVSVTLEKEGFESISRKMTVNDRNRNEFALDTRD